MTEKYVTASEVTPLLEQLVAILNEKEQALQAVTIANLVAIFALHCEGQDPYDMARRVYKITKDNISENLAAINLLTKLPKGAKPN